MAEIDNEVKEFLKEYPEMEHNLLKGSDGSLYVYFTLEQFKAVYKKVE